MSRVTIGVLALQGAFARHVSVLQTLGVEAFEIRQPAELSKCDGLIIPGGESTTIMYQIHFMDFFKSLSEFSSVKPVFGTCAGLILMAREIISDPMVPFGWLDIAIERNAYGRQVESFQQEVELHFEPKSRKHFPAIFIRAPRIRQVGARVDVLSEIAGEPVLVREGHHLGATFHPELSGDPAIHEYFISLVKKSR